MIAALIVTKNEADLLRLNLEHHLAWGIDCVAVADNASTDATREICASFGDAVRYRRFTDFHTRQTQRHLMLRELVDEQRGSVEWAAISDTDEFFYASATLRDILGAVPPDVVAVNFDAKLFLPTAVDSPNGSVIERRTYRTPGGDSPLHSSYTAGKTFYRAAWLGSIPVDHWCKNHEHLCVDVPHERYRHPLPLVHHYMIQDEDQFVEKVTRLIEWAKRPAGFRKGLRWQMTRKRDRPLPPWSEPWKKVWWSVYQQEGIEGVRRYYRDVYVVPADRVAGHVADGELVCDDQLANYARTRSLAG
jgi:hypothetical protein